MFENRIFYGFLTISVITLTTLSCEHTCRDQSRTRYKSYEHSVTIINFYIQILKIIQLAITPPIPGIKRLFKNASMSSDIFILYHLQHLWIDNFSYIWIRRPRPTSFNPFIQCSTTLNMVFSRFFWCVLEKDFLRLETRKMFPLHTILFGQL